MLFIIDFGWILEGFWEDFGRLFRWFFVSYLKKRLTNNFLEWTNEDIEQRIQTLDENKHLKLEPAIFLIKKFGNHVIEHMNSKDTFDENFDTFIDYANVLDKKLNTNFEDVYPEYKSNYKYIKYSAKKG